MTRNYFLAIAVLSLGALIGVWISKDATTPTLVKRDPMPLEKTSPPFQPRAKNLGERETRDRNSLLEELITIDGERLIRFNSKAAYADALRRLGDSGATLLGRMDRFNALRLRTDDPDRLRDWLGDEGQDFANYLVTLPLLPDTNAQTGGGVPFGRSALEFLGITGDNSSWGEGVKIAIVDTGIQPHLALNSKNITTIEIEGSPIVSEVHGHGTAVASIIAGNHDALTGVAPSAELLSIPVADESGNSNSFLLAQGIAAAVENGAQVINVSMGSYGDSLFVQEAIAYAIEEGAIIIASVGNEGFTQAAYPAGNKGVVSVGTIDANGSHVAFSNTSDTLSIAAPGYEVTAAWPGDSAIAFTGTSASAPFVSGTIAAIISESNSSLSGQEAWLIAQNYTNEAGAPGNDVQFGEGILNTGRAIQRDTPEIYDLAVAQPYYDFDQNRLQVTVENRGTEPLAQSTLTVGADGASFPITVGILEPNERAVYEFPVTSPALSDNGLLHVTSQTIISSQNLDALPFNNQRTDIISAPIVTTDDP